MSADENGPSVTTIASGDLVELDLSNIDSVTKAFQKIAAPFKSIPQRPTAPVYKKPKERFWESGRTYGERVRKHEKRYGESLKKQGEEYQKTCDAGNNIRDNAKKEISILLWNILDLHIKDFKNSPQMWQKLDELIQPYYDAFLRITGKKYMGALGNADFLSILSFFEKKYRENSVNFNKVRGILLARDTRCSETEWLRQGDCLSKQLFSGPFWNIKIEREKDSAYKFTNEQYEKIIPEFLSILEFAFSDAATREKLMGLVVKQKFTDKSEFMNSFRNSYSIILFLDSVNTESSSDYSLVCLPPNDSANSIPWWTAELSQGSERILIPSEDEFCRFAEKLEQEKAKILSGSSSSSSSSIHPSSKEYEGTQPKDCLHSSKTPTPSSALSSSRSWSSSSFSDTPHPAELNSTFGSAESSSTGIEPGLSDPEDSFRSIPTCEERLFDEESQTSLDRPRTPQPTKREHFHDRKQRPKSNIEVRKKMSTVTSGSSSSTPPKSSSSSNGKSDKAHSRESFSRLTTLSSESASSSSSLGTSAPHHATASSGALYKDMRIYLLAYALSKPEVGGKSEQSDTQTHALNVLAAYTDRLSETQSQKLQESSQQLLNATFPAQYQYQDDDGCVVSVRDIPQKKGLDAHMIFEKKELNSEKITTTTFTETKNKATAVEVLGEYEQAVRDTVAAAKKLCTVSGSNVFVFELDLNKASKDDKEHYLHIEARYCDALLAAGIMPILDRYENGSRGIADISGTAAEANPDTAAWRTYESLYASNEDVAGKYLTAIFADPKNIDLQEELINAFLDAKSPKDKDSQKSQYKKTYKPKESKESKESIEAWMQLKNSSPSKSSTGPKSLTFFFSEDDSPDPFRHPLHQGQEVLQSEAKTAKFLLL